MLELERITFDGNFCDIARCSKTPGGSYCEDGRCSGKDVWERLKLLEGILGRWYDADRLKEIWEADRGGRCAVLFVKPSTNPCVSASQLILVDGNGDIVDDAVCQVVIGQSLYGKTVCQYQTHEGFCFFDEDVGKYAFKTYGEAKEYFKNTGDEEKLRKLESLYDADLEEV